MALLVTTDNRPIFLPSEQANLLWMVKTGEKKGTQATKAKIKKIAKWYLNRQTAPQSFIDAHPLSNQKQLPTQPRLPYAD